MAYPEPTGGPVQKGLDLTSHNGSNYPQPNSANQPDTSSTASPSSAVPGPEAYRPNLAGAPPEGAVSVTPPGVRPGNAGDAAGR